jgi:hypothetical protein
MLTRWLRRIVVLSLLGGTADLVRRKLKRADEIKPSDYRPFVPVTPPPAPKPTPTAEVTTSAVTETPVAAELEVSSAALASPAATGDAWVLPVDDVCPVSHPVKGNDQSKIFHVPGGASYERTVPERCYVSAEAAEADGYRSAKR